MKEKEEKFQEPFPVVPEKYRQYMLSQDETGELANEIKRLQEKPIKRVDLDEI